MTRSDKTIVYPSGQLALDFEDDIIVCRVGNMRIAGVNEFLKYLSDIGDIMKERGTGKVIALLSEMKNFDISIRAAAVQNLDDLLLKKARYLLLAAVKGSSLFENLSMQTAITVARPLSKKFLDGKLFDTKYEAVQWLKNFQIPLEFRNDKQ